MNKEYINCTLAMTQHCPHSSHDFMLNLFASSVKPTKILNGKMIDMANSLCEKCDKFNRKN